MIVSGRHSALMIDRQEIIDRALAGNGRIANDIYSPLDPTFNHDIPQRQL